jgi:hypothetical protein
VTSVVVRIFFEFQGKIELLFPLCVGQFFHSRFYPDLSSVLRLVFTLIFRLVFLLDQGACAPVSVCVQGSISHPPDFLGRYWLIFLLRASVSPRTTFSPTPRICWFGQPVLPSVIYLRAIIFSRRRFGLSHSGLMLCCLVCHPRIQGSLSPPVSIWLCCR